MEQTELFKRKDVIVFIDGTNLCHTTYHCYNINFIDIHLLSDKLCGIYRNLKQIRYYYSPFIKHINQDLYLEQQKYIEQITKDSLILPIPSGKHIKKPMLLSKHMKEKLLETIPEEQLITYVEKGLDVSIAIDMLLMAGKKEYEQAILVSGDGDFAPVIKTIREIYKLKIQVAAFEIKMSISADESIEKRCFHLKNVASSFINLAHYIPAIIKKQKTINP